MSRWPGRLGVNRDFDVVWFGQGISNVGDAVTYLALPLLALLTLHVRAWQIGALTAANYAAYAVCVLPLGAWLDTRPRRPYVIAGDLGRLVAIGSIPLSRAVGLLGYGQLVVVAAAVGAFSAMFDVAYQSWVPELVEPVDLVRANGLLGATESAGQLAGPGVGGLLVASLGGAYTLAVDAASFGVAALTSARVRTHRPAPSTSPAERPRLRRQIADGLRWLWTMAPLRLIALCSATVNVALAAWTAVETVFLVRTLHTPSSIIGAVLTVGAVGGILGGLCAGSLVRRVGVGRALFLSVVTGGLAGLVGPLATAPFGPWSVSIALFGVSAALSVYNAAAVSTRQRLAPADMIGRVTAANRVLTYGAMPLGALAGGVLASGAGPRATLVLAAAGFAAAAGWLAPLAFGRHRGGLAEGN
jgi:MFS family permease